MTTGGMLVIVVMLGFTLAGWLLAVFTRHQVKTHIAARDRAAASFFSTPDERSDAYDLDLPTPSVAGTSVYATGIMPTGRVIVGSSTRRKSTIVHEG